MRSKFMKKILSIIMSVVMVLTLSVCAFAAYAPEDEKLSFNSDGKFKIMMINDTQDVGKGNDERTVNFINAALDAEKPDLVVFVGDQLSDMYPNASKADFELALKHILQPLEDRGIPFLATLGNHDHDREATVVEDEQYEIYNSYSMCFNGENGADHFTFNTPVYGTDGQMKFNIYMMDTNNKAPKGGYAGITAEQLAWYNETSAALKAENGGEAMPSLLFQHVPVKEIYSLMKECKWNAGGAIYSRRDSKWYTLNQDLMVEEGGKLGEAPCSENFDVITGQYQAWLENGDIMGAFFAHDHVNNFVGVNEDGIKMGYNGGTGFRAYGNGDQRSVRVFELDENDVTNYQTRLVTYAEVVGSLKLVNSDVLTPAWLTRIMKVIYACIGWIIDIFHK